MCPQTESSTNEGYAEIAKYMAGEAASAFKKVGCIKTSCTADESQTKVGVTWSTESGLTLQDADTVSTITTTVANDTVQVDNIFTAGEAATVKGFGVCNGDGDVLFGICCFAADITLANNGRFTIQLKAQFKAG